MSQKVSTSKMFGYSLGDASISITMNGIGNFAMLFYTQILGMNAVHAGLALSITTLWDAISDPLMGHISDHTRSRTGRRLVYLIPGGLLMAVSFWLLWVLPQNAGSPTGIFWAVLLLNLLLRTALTVFMVPHTALGFELCSTYVSRSKLQGMRNFVNQMTNLIFGALAWTLFFKDGTAEDGSRIDGTLIADNYLSMATSLAAVIILVLVIYRICVNSCREDTRERAFEGGTLGGFFRSMAAIFSDKLAWFVFGLVGFSLLAMLLVSQVQMFTYVYFMEFDELEKTLVHGAGMLAAALGSLFALPWLVAKYEKKGAAYISIVMSCFGGVMLSVIFNGGLLQPGQELSSIPIATVVFGGLQAIWWGGAGILVALAMSMIADIAEVTMLKKGEQKDGAYSSTLIFFQKAAMSFGLLLTGGMVEYAGIDPMSNTQTAEALRNISMLTFLSGPLLMVLAFVVIVRYPVDRRYLDALRSAAANVASVPQSANK